MNKFVGLVSLAMLGVGFLLGLLPVHTAGVSCGNAFEGSFESGALAGRVVQDECSDARSSRRTPAIILLVLGGVGSIGSLVVYQAAQKRRRPTTGYPPFQG